MRFKTWPVAALGLGSLLLLIVVSMLESSRRAQEIYAELDQLNTHHHNVDAKLRRLRSDVNLSGIFVRDYLLDVSREHATEYRERLAEFRQTNLTTLAELRLLAEPHAERIRNLGTQLDEYWQTFEPLFDWTATEKIFRSASFLRREVVPRREAVLAIAQEIEELNNANLAAQRAEVTRRQAVFRNDLHRLLWQTVLLGVAVALIAVDVSITSHCDHLKVSVTDNGIGFDSTQRGNGLGLRGIDERVKELHGTMTIGRADGGGTTLAIHLPSPARETEEPLARAAG
jgi:histidine kinase/DNA gyrase B/HSP90-like ATPase